ncbi:MAG: N-acetylmuramic acid 6-phosphate etherase [Culicoidibacterales bacterium]
MEKIDLTCLMTEKRNENTDDIDRISTRELVQKMNDEDKKVAIAVEQELDVIALAVDGIVERMKRGGRLIYIGAGTSGRLGILDASECPPTYGVSDQLVQGKIAGGLEAIFKAKEGAEDSMELGVQDLQASALNENDTVVGIAASGRTPYVIGGLRYANEIGALTISLTCNAASAVAKEAKIAISPVVGPELVTGSTRLKAGTAQKLVLNMLSTSAMIQMGKVYGNLMVDVQSTNAKLVERAKNIICEATGVSKDIAANYLSETNSDVKLAIFMILSGAPLETARTILIENHGYIAKALDEYNQSICE